MNGPRFVVIDLELSHPEPAEAHIVEWAAVVIEPEWFGAGGIGQTMGGLVRPPISIPPETSAVHHIIDADVHYAPTWAECGEPEIARLLAVPGTIVVGHSIENDRAVLERHATVPIPQVEWLCTYKAALRMWPEAPRHGNEALRYWLGHGTGRTGHQRPHTAAHDAEVTARIFLELVKVASVLDMLEWTVEPALLPRCPLGAWRGQPWSECDDGFLDWVLYKIQDRPDVLFSAQREVERRRKARAEEREVAEARRALREVDPDAEAAPVDDIPF